MSFGKAQAERPVLFYEEDAQLLLVSRHRERLSEAFRFVVADAALVEGLLDKAQFQVLAQRHQLPVPPARQFNPAATDPAELGLRFPLIIKPLTRLQRWNETLGLRKAFEAKDIEALRALWPQLLALDLDLLAQELIPGAEAQIESYHCYVDQRGSIAGEFTGRKIRTFPLAYGHTTALEITHAADVRGQGRAIVERIGLTGVAKLDFKRDPQGKLHLLEINPRFNLWHNPGALAGVNIPALVYADLVGLPRPAVAPAKAGVRWCRVWQDLPAARAAGIPLTTWAAWAWRCERKAALSWDDPLPLLRAALHRLIARRAVGAKRPRAQLDRLVKLALISDIHANLQALQATLDDIAAQSVDRIVCLGDIVGYNANPGECIALVRRANCLCVAGNHDRAVSRQITTETFSNTAARAAAWTRERLSKDELAFLAGLPLKAEIAGELIAVHGALHPETGCEIVRLDNDESRGFSFEALMTHPSGARICAFGHTHRAAVHEFRRGRIAARPEDEVRLRDDAYYLINPGAVGEPRGADRRASYMVVDLARPRRDRSSRSLRCRRNLPRHAPSRVGAAPVVSSCAGAAGAQERLARITA